MFVDSIISKVDLTAISIANLKFSSNWISEKFLVMTLDITFSLI